MSAILLILAVIAALHGFQTGGAIGFMYLIGSVVVGLFGLASLGMDTQSRGSRRLPPHAPGWNNQKKGTK